MWDGWERDLGSLRRCTASLEGYNRILNKASIKNHGSKQHPCPTLNLQRVKGSSCKGIAIEFPIDRERGVLQFLEKREGRNFHQRPLLVRLSDQTNVQAYVSIYEGPSLISPSTLQETADMVKKAVGQNGSCRDYIGKLMESLAVLGIDDPSVSQLWNALRADSSV